MTSDGVLETILEGPMLVAIPIAVLAGLVSFFSPCVVPLIPGYLSYVTGLSVTELDGGRRGRMVLGASLFVLGFTAVFVSLGSVFGAFGFRLASYEREISIVMGAVIIVLGFAFMGMLPLMQRDFRIHKVPAVGLVAAPFLGALFAIGWTPCIGPALSGVLALATTPGADASRGAGLAFFYCVGLGVPFIAAALAFGRFLRVSSWARRHQRAITIAGGVMLIVVGLLLVTGLWTSLIAELRGVIDGFAPVI